MMNSVLLRAASLWWQSWNSATHRTGSILSLTSFVFLTKKIIEFYLFDLIV